ncbi:MAG: type I-E CRISPR-associated protein Cas6/Cse3/CasE [Deltaproteobacteria bacterium]|nr:type I-E CRISPR-associated protein Cas6/Cse3/CasE [Deltaproteobacteria bacterium]
MRSSDSGAYLLKIPLDAARLFALSRQARFSERGADEGYLIHSVLRELWQDLAPIPFVVRNNHRELDVWGYSGSSPDELQARVRAFGDPELVRVLVDVERIAGRAMPVLECGKRIGYQLRAMPVVRLSKALASHRAGAEIDAFLARSFSVGPGEQISREAVHREWLLNRFAGRPAGVRIETVRVAAMARGRFVRRGQGQPRKACRIERPDVRFDGEAIVEDGAEFLRFLMRGVGRHRSFGFGAFLVVPPGAGSER